MRVDELQTPALLVERSHLEANLAEMARVRPGDRCRPHVKAHKSTSLARLQRDAGHPGFTVATIREAEGLHAAGLADDVLLANVVLDARRIGALVADGGRVTVAVDSEVAVAAAADGGVREVVIDVCVGLPRTGCRPEDAGRLAALARSRGLAVRGVMGYEGHLFIIEDASQRRPLVREAMQLLASAAADVGGEVVSAGGTATYAEDIPWVTEVQAGSYVLMDTAYQRLGLPFAQALSVLGTVISVSPQGWAVTDFGLKSLGMDHGNPTVPGHPVWFCSDEHTTVGNSLEQGAPLALAVGDRVRGLPAHVDPTVAMHEQLWLVDRDEVLERWPVDLRGW